MKLRMSSRKKMESLRKSDCQSRRSNCLILERESEWEKNQSNKSRKKPSTEEQEIPHKGAQSVDKTLDKNKLKGTSPYWVF